MQRIAVFTTEDGGEVAIEVADDAQSGASGVTAEATGAPPGLTVRGIPDSALTTRGIPNGRVVERTQQSFDDAIEHARPAVTALLRQVKAQEDAPDEIEVEFGLQLSLDVGAYIAKASSGANFRVVMRWRSLSRNPVRPPLQ
ncbi:CU044_2847 family protein [Agromyces humatus]|uniref:Trypsin-co-occurring domain-containing protein n=1 Tax=Agromyces humatus TaxID=279573 RepID=A0ABP4X2U1_9MICO|nr:CU044_2847 family protein [Agromyces humatus]